MSAGDDKPVFPDQPPARPVRFYWLPTLAAVIVVAAALLIRQYSEAKKTAEKIRVYHHSADRIMGSGCHITIATPPQLKLPPQDLIKSALDEVKKAEELLSFYDPQSDISRVNAAPPGTLVPVNPLTWRTLMEALRFSYLTDGAFDPATGSLSRLYRWSRKEERKLPDEAAIAKARAGCGADNLLLEREGMKVGRKSADTLLDLGGLAQGLGTDIIIRVLRENGVRNAAVEIGGEVRVIGKLPINAQDNGGVKGESRLWNVGIQDPRNPEGLRKMAVRPNFAVSTSGDYEKFFEFQGKRYSHIINPQTGLPVSGGIISATVIVPGSCQTADALATCACVMGEAKFRELLKKMPAVEAFLIDEQQNLIHLEPGDANSGVMLTDEDQFEEEDSGDEAADQEAEDDESGEDDEDDEDQVSGDNFWPVDAGYGSSHKSPAPADAPKAKPAPTMQAVPAESKTPSVNQTGSGNATGH